MIDTALRVAALARKELLAVLKDRRAVISLLMPAILECLIFGYAATYDLSEVPYAVLDGDRSDASRRVLAALDGSGVFRRVADVDRAADLAAVIDRKDAVVAIRFEGDFERRLLAGGPAPVQVIADGRNSNTAGIALSYVNAIVESLNRRARAEAPGDGGAAAAAFPRMQVSSRAWFNPNLESRWNMVPALIGTLTMMQTLLLTSMSVAREREQGTYDQLLVTPLGPAEILAGKALPAVLVGAVQAATVLAVAELWFDIPFSGSFAVLSVGLVLFLTAAVGIGLLVSSFARTMQQAMLYSFVVLMPFMLLSGLTTPIANMPPALRALTFANPLRYAIEIARRVYLEGAGLGRLGSDLWPMAAISAVTLTVAGWTFRRRLG